MAKNYMGVNLTGRSLMHYRTKGSRNGYSKDPNYRPTGQRAVGRLVNGRYVYDQGAQNNWQQQAAAARDDKETYTKYKEGKINAITAKDNSGDVTTMYHPKGPYGVNYTAIKTEKLGAASKGKKNNWQQAGNLTRSMTEVARDLRNREAANSPRKITKQLKTTKPPYVSKEYQEELAYNSKKNVYPSDAKSAMGYRYSPAYSNDNNPKGYHITDPRYTTAGTQKIENAAKIAKQKNEAKYKGGTFTYDPKTGTTVKDTPALREEQARIEAGAKAREKRQKKREREAKVNKMKNAILSVFKKKK